jgi:hypothetical protein
VTIVTTALPNVVKAYTPAALSWSVEGSNAAGFTPIGTTTHRIYVSFGTPAGSNPTNRRMNWLCNNAWQADTTLQAIEGVDPNGNFGGIGIHAALDKNPPCDGQSLSPNGDPPCTGTGGTIVDDWRLLAGPPYVGECHQQAHLMNLALQLIGAGAANEYLTHASTDANPMDDLETTTSGALGITQDLDGDGEIGEEVWELIFAFEPGNAPNMNWNNFEGSLVIGGRYYAVWPSLNADSACELLLELRDAGVPETKQFWVYSDPDTGAFISYHPIEVPFPSCP